LVLALGLGDRRDRHDRLATINADGTGFRVLISLRGHLASAPMCAPDGRIFFGLTRGDPAITTVSSIESDGSGYAVVTRASSSRDQVPSFSLSRDARWLAMFDSEEGAVLMAANGNGRKSVFLTTKRMATVAGEKDSWMGGFLFGITSSWSPDGTRVAIASSGGAYAMNPLSSSLYIARVDGSGVRKVPLPDTARVITPAWQPQ
jgi:Tol biopolymer transport system component